MCIPSPKPQIWIPEICLQKIFSAFLDQTAVNKMSTKISILAADSKKFCMFNVKNGKYVSTLNIPAQLERSNGKKESDCAYEQPGLNYFTFEEHMLIAVHDSERGFPAVLDIYKFWGSSFKTPKPSSPKPQI